jgi:hypothetical protein
MNAPVSDANTIDELLSRHARATAVCRTCGTQAAVDLDLMRRSFGGNGALRRIAYRIVCTGCGAADCSIVVTPPPQS